MNDAAHQPITVLIVDDQKMVRMGLGLIVGLERDMLVVGEGGDGAEAIALASDLRPDVILMDVRMPNLNGIDATNSILGDATAGAVVLITTFDDEDYLLDGIRAGASGFLLKDAGPELLTAAIRAAYAGNALIEPSMVRSLLEHRLVPRTESQDRADPGPSGSAALLDNLSPRELDVLAAVARGSSNGSIATELWVSEATVKTHISSILSKTGLTSRVQIAVLAYESGFIYPGNSSAP